MKSVATQWLINGQKGALDPADRGLAYGDGLFETMAAQDGTIRWLDYHLDRVVEGCRQLAIPEPSRHTLREEISLCTPATGNAVVKLMLTRGSGARGYCPPDKPNPARIVGAIAWPDFPSSHYTNGIELRSCDMRLGRNPRLAGIKHLCRLEQVLAQSELAQLNADEGLMLDTMDNVIGGTRSNIFAARGTTLLTPQISQCGVRGVMRRIVLEHCPQIEMQAHKTDLTLHDLYQAEEIFVTNAVFGIWPVRRLNEIMLAPGEKTRLLQRLLGYMDNA